MSDASDPTGTNAPPEIYSSIFLTGHFCSGKSTFIRTISEIEIVSSERGITSPENIQVSMDFGRISVEGGVFYLFVPPRARRFDFMWDIVAEGGNLGFIVMVDSARPEYFREAQSIIQTFIAYYEYPFVVAANFQDHPEAWGVADLKIALHIADDVPVVPCVATERKSVANVLLTLCEKILQDIEKDAAEK